MKIVEQFARMEPDLTWKAAIEKIARAARVSHKSAGHGFESDCELVRKLISLGHESVLEHVSMSAYIVTDRAIANELTRHRIGVAFTQESTRYVDYADSSDYWAGIQFIKPSGIADENAWQEVCEDAERAYIRMRESGVTPEMARSVLPLCTATTLYMTANLREWRHIFRLRCGKSAHPDIRRLCADLLRQARELVPVVFEDLEAAE